MQWNIKKKGRTQASSRLKRRETVKKSKGVELKTGKKKKKKKKNRSFAPGERLYAWGV